MSNVVKVSNLIKSYGTTIAVDRVSFEVHAGEIFGLLGPTGAGNTTTLECLLGLRTPDSGQIQILGMEHDRHINEIRQRLGVQLQTTGLQPMLTVNEQLNLFASLFNRSLPVDAVIAMVDLGEKSKSVTKALSGGQKQRLAVAIALVSDPDLVFLDEPTTGLDPQSRRNLWEVIRNLKSSGKSVVLTTHYMEEAEQLCDRVAILDHGRIIELDSPQKLIQSHFSETAIEFSTSCMEFYEQLNTLPEVVNVHTNGSTENTPEFTTYTLYTTSVPHSLAGLLELAEAQSIILQDIVVRQASLEDVFLKLTGRRIRD